MFVLNLAGLGSSFWGFVVWDLGFGTFLGLGSRDFLGLGSREGLWG